MNLRACAAVALSFAIVAGSAQAGGLAAPEVESEVFGVEEPAVAAGALGGTRTLAIIAALVLVAAVAGGGGGGDGDDDDNGNPPVLN